MTEQKLTAVKAAMAKLMGVLQTNEALVGNLAARWDDEREYEDINDYRTVLAPFFQAAGFDIVKMSKRPFGFTTKSVDGSFKVTVGKTRFRVTHVGG